MPGAKQLYREGRKHYKSGNYKKAMRIFRKILRIKPDLPNLWNMLGVCHAKIGKAEKAVEMFKKGLKYGPLDESLYQNLGNIYLRMERFLQALEIFKKAVDLFPDNEKFWNNLGVAHSQLKDRQKAINAFKKALDTQPNYERAWKNLCVNYVKRGVDFNFEELKPQHEISWHYLAKSLSEARLHDEAIEAINRCLTLNPGFHEAFKVRQEIRDEKKRDERREEPSAVADRKEVRAKKPPQEVQVPESESEPFSDDPYYERLKKIQEKFQDRMKEDEGYEKFQLHSPEYEKLSLDERFKVLQAKHRKRKDKGLVDMETTLESTEDLKEEVSAATTAPPSEVRARRKKKPRPRKKTRTKTKASWKVATVLPSKNVIKVKDKFYEKADLWFVIDGANVCLDRQNTHGQGFLANLKIMRKRLETLGLSTYDILCDRSLRHKIDEPLLYKRMSKRGELIETPADTEADYFILNRAKAKDAFIISNDRFRDHYENFGKKWVRSRRISFTFIEEEIYFDGIFRHVDPRSENSHSR